MLGVFEASDMFSIAHFASCRVEPLDVHLAGLNPSMQHPKIQGCNILDSVHAHGSHRASTMCSTSLV